MILSCFQLLCDATVLGAFLFGAGGGFLRTACDYIPLIHQEVGEDEDEAIDGDIVARTLEDEVVNYAHADSSV